MDCGTRDGPKWSFSWASHDDMDFMRPPPQFSGAYTHRYEATAGLPVPPSDLFGKPNWRSLTSTSTSTSSLVGNPRPQEQEQASSMREMIFSIAAMQPINIDPESVKPPKRKNVKISKDPQSVAARHRRERISERIRILQRLVPGGTKMDTASMLDEAIHYLKFLQSQVHSLQLAASHNTPTSLTDLFISSGANNNPSSNYLSLQPPHHPHHYC